VLARVGMDHEYTGLMYESEVEKNMPPGMVDVYRLD
jgi:hypothetical protein